MNNIYKVNKDFNFSNLASTYDEGFAKRFYNLLLREIYLSSGVAVLDVGCGTGVLLYIPTLVSRGLSAKLLIVLHGYFV